MTIATNKRLSNFSFPSLNLCSSFLDGGAVIKALASSTSEPLHPLTSYILSSPVRNHTSSEIWSLSSQREVFKKAYFKHFSSFQFDFLLCPTQVCSAPRVSRVEPSTSKPGEMELKKGVESSKYWNYTSFWNLVDYPSISFPSGIVSDSEKDQQWLEGQKEESSLGELDDLNRKEWEENKKEFDRIDIGLQLVGKRFAEEVSSEMMKSDLRAARALDVSIENSLPLLF